MRVRAVRRVEAPVAERSRCVVVLFRYLVLCTRAFRLPMLFLMCSGCRYRALLIELYVAYGISINTVVGFKLSTALSASGSQIVQRLIITVTFLVIRWYGGKKNE